LPSFLLFSSSFFSDTSGDGKLQRKEFMGVLKEMGIELTKKQVTELYFVLDRDGDGEIDTKELLRG
jgi:Ca2+-binding EF-hand superfamily protein